MPFADSVLFFLAKQLYRTEIAHSAAMKNALKEPDKYDAYRFGQLDNILDAGASYGIDVTDKIVLDFGCNDGAITPGYAFRGARRVIGVDIDKAAVEKARAACRDDRVIYHVSETTTLPLDDASVDLIICYDVFEHVADPPAILAECRRVMKPGAKMLIGTWGWGHPCAPHLWATMPVPWAHVFFSEKSVLRACRRVYDAPWYVPNMHDLDENGGRKPKFLNDTISKDYLNKLSIDDFERVFRESGLSYVIHPRPFGSKFARWSVVFLGIPWLREYITGYLWVVLQKQDE